MEFKEYLQREYICKRLQKYNGRKTHEHKNTMWIQWLNTYMIICILRRFQLIVI